MFCYKHTGNKEHTYVSSKWGSEIHCHEFIHFHYLKMTVGNIFWKSDEKEHKCHWQIECMQYFQLDEQR